MSYATANKCRKKQYYEYRTEKPCENLEGLIRGAYFYLSRIYENIRQMVFDRPRHETCGTIKYCAVDGENRVFN